MTRTPLLLGDEMLCWSDLDGKHGPGPVRGAVLRPLLDAAYGRTLVAGPHDPALIDRISTGDLSLLVRGVDDGEVLAGRYADAEVHVGSLGRFRPAEQFDTIVALDGLERLGSAEAAELGWGRSLDLLRDLLRPGGLLLLGVENFLGLHRLITLPPAVTDSDWGPPAEDDPTRPAGLSRVRERLGLPVARVFAAYPSPYAPTALLDTAVPAGEDDAALLARACATIDDVLMDPRRIAAGAARHGVTAELAPAWILTTRDIALADDPVVEPPEFAESAPHAVRELIIERDRLARELAEARAKHAWYEELLRHRERALKHARLAATTPGQALLGGARAAKRALRRVRPRG